MLLRTLGLMQKRLSMSMEFAASQSMNRAGLMRCLWQSGIRIRTMSPGNSRIYAPQKTPSWLTLGRSSTAMMH